MHADGWSFKLPFLVNKSGKELFNLETAVEREKAVHAIHVHGECEKFVVTLVVMRSFSHSLGA